MRYVIPFMVAAAMIAGAAGATAQEQTAMTFPFTPVAEDCQIPPRTVDQILSLTGAGTSNVETTAEPAASPEVQAATTSELPGDQVLTTIRELAACIAAADMHRTFALFSDEYLERLQERSGALLEDDFLLNAIWATQGQFFLGDEDWATTLTGYLEASQTASPAPGEAGVSGAITAVPAVWELGADRVAAVVTFQGLGCFLQCDFAFIFTQDEMSGRYQIDEVIEIFDLAEIPSG